MSLACHYLSLFINILQILNFICYLECWKLNPDPFQFIQKQWQENKIILLSTNAAAMHHSGAEIGLKYCFADCNELDFAFSVETSIIYRSEPLREFEDLLIR